MIEKIIGNTIDELIEKINKIRANREIKLITISFKSGLGYYAIFEEK